METLSSLLALWQGIPTVAGTPSQSANNTNFDVGLKLVEQTVELPVIWDTVALRWRLCNDNTASHFSLIHWYRQFYCKVKDLNCKIFCTSFHTCCKLPVRKGSDASNCGESTISFTILQGAVRPRYSSLNNGQVAWLADPPNHDDVIKWKHFPRYWPLVRGIHRSPVNSPHKGQWGWWFETPSRPLWRNCNGWVCSGKKDSDGKTNGEMNAFAI